MYSFFIIVIFIAISPVFTSVARNRTNPCSVNEIACDDGGCVNYDYVCDGHANCADGSDEAACINGLPDLTFSKQILNRSRRQTTCTSNQWKCRDGSCIAYYEKCDGVVDCTDGSDETHPLCRKTKCQNNWFRCTYGACVDGTAPCNGVKECADNSDELLPRCRNETVLIGDKYRCRDGLFISSSSLCDGEVNCVDGSDEIINVCADISCPNYLFQCAYGACVDRGSDCNDITECADNSDESDELCNRSLPITSSTSTTTVKPIPTGGCILPEYPAHGSYSVKNVPNAVPGQAFNSVIIQFTCKTGHDVEGRKELFCLDGSWSDKFPKCIRFCQLPKNPTVEYTCGAYGSIEGAKICKELEPNGSIVQPKCAPNYYSQYELDYMKCIDGFWSSTPNCIADCGTVTSDGDQLIIDGRRSKHGELPWHVGIYRKTTTPYMQICGGSLIRTTTVISAAHCFWMDEDVPIDASMYAVAAGKLYRPWNNPEDESAQKSDVSKIVIPDHFRGGATNFQDDIALIFVTSVFVYKTYVRPVCLDFNIRFEDAQLTEGTLGKVAGWGLMAEDGTSSQVLQVTELPLVNTNTCFAKSPPSFRAYITSDKICAGYANGTALCKGDSGGGLVFPQHDRITERYYLRGIVSTAPRNEHLCNAFALTTFTQISKHEKFIKRNLIGD